MYYHINDIIFLVRFPQFVGSPSRDVWTTAYWRDHPPPPRHPNRLGLLRYRLSYHPLSEVTLQSKGRVVAPILERPWTMGTRWTQLLWARGFIWRDDDEELTGWLMDGLGASVEVSFEESGCWGGGNVRGFFGGLDYSVFFFKKVFIHTLCK